MDKLDTFKAILPLIPEGYRRPLMIYLHIEEIMRIINSLKECMNKNYSLEDTGAFDISKLSDMFSSSSPKGENDMLKMMSMFMSGGLGGLGGMEQKDGNIKEASGSKAESSSKPDKDTDEIDDIFKDFLDETKGYDNNE